MRTLFLLLTILCTTAVFGQYKNVSITEYINSPLKRTILVDVRTAEEFAAGHLPNAINIDVKRDDFESKFAKIRKRKRIAVYCRSGKRSAMAAEKLDVLGYVKITNLTGGYLEYSEKK